MLTNSQTILVTGGAGFIGSHMVLTLCAQGFHVVVLDNLIKGNSAAIFDAEFIQGDVGNKTLLNDLFSKYNITAVMHFAAYIEVAESVKSPEKYYQNNVTATLTLLEAMINYQVKHLVFSSSAAVYGEPHYTPIDEAHPLQAMNPYGRSKWMVEEMIKDFSHAYELNYAILRYFNAAGADIQARIGECHEPESHLIPLILKVAQGKLSSIKVYGNDYATPDGTCVRDFIHVIDLCDAHAFALKKILTENANLICNLGTGKGYSVAEVIDVATTITQREIPVEMAARRFGDPAVLVANAAYAKHVLQWQPRYSELETIIKHAWNFANTIKC